MWRGGVLGVVVGVVAVAGVVLGVVGITGVVVLRSIVTNAPLKEQSLCRCMVRLVFEAICTSGWS